MLTLKKKIEIAAILCSIGICSFGQNVFAGEFLRLPAQTNAKVEQVVQTRLLEEQRAYLMQAQLMTKVNLEQQIKDKPVYIPKTKHVVTQRERSILERIVEAEATDKDEKSKILVANVILNRVRSKEFPKLDRSRCVSESLWESPGFHRQLMEDMNPSISQRVQKEA